MIPFIIQSYKERELILFSSFSLFIPTSCYLSKFGKQMKMLAHDICLHDSYFSSEKIEVPKTLAPSYIYKK